VSQKPDTPPGQENPTTAPGRSEEAPGQVKKPAPNQDLPEDQPEPNQDLPEQQQP